MKIIYVISLLIVFSNGVACKKEKEPVLKDKPAKVLVFSKTRGYRHECIEPGFQAMQAYFASSKIELTGTEDSTWFTPDRLSGYDAVMFFQTTGDVLNVEQEKALETFIRAGKGFIGVHAAADTEYEWPWYAGLVGVQFAFHPDIQNAVVVKRDTAHASCKHLPDRWTRHDEWYNFRALPTGVNVLLSVDEATYQGGTHGADHPVSWYHAYDGGRAFYTAMGHTVESYQDTLFLRHVLEGTKWALGRAVK
jgi:type 1 glutamine amidotransferase